MADWACTCDARHIILYVPLFVGVQFASLSRGPRCPCAFSQATRTLTAHVCACVCPSSLAKLRIQSAVVKRMPSMQDVIAREVQPHLEEIARLRERLNQLGGLAI